MSQSPLKKQADKKITARWNYAELFNDGYVGVPTTFLELYTKLNPPLTSGEAIFVIHLMNHKWDEKAPFPSYKTIADRMGVSPKAVQRHAANLEGKKYLKRISRIGASNEFDLTSLFDALYNAQLTVVRRPKTRGVKKNG